ncbi:MAG: PaaI family thioesterase [Bacteroidota bacterium]|nr:PaaI family thioesterase [Bacteroidota bacterium]
MEKLISNLFNKDEFSKSCGIQIDEMHLGYAQCSMEITGNHLNGIGTLMGGAVFTLADFTFGVAANSHGNVAVTLNANISFFQPCNHGIVTAVAKEISRTRRTGVYRISIADDKGLLIAEMTGTCYFKSVKIETLSSDA